MGIEQDKFENTDKFNLHLINLIKELGVDCEGVIDSIELLKHTRQKTGESLIEPDMRWVNIGRTHLQEGISALVRSIAKLTTF
mgnify:CR=1 FL=1